jgi:hypothetical protein
VNNWVPIIVAIIAATTALAGYLLNNTINRRIEKARYYAEARLMQPKNMAHSRTSLSVDMTPVRRHEPNWLT